MGRLSSNIGWMPTADDWSIPALREHFDQRFTDAEQHLDDIIDRIDERHRTFEVQVAEAKAASNEWRGALQDRERATVSRVEFEGKNKALEEKFDQSAKTQGALLAALSTEMRAGFKALDDLLSTQRGGRAARDDLRVWVLGGLSALSIIFGIVMAIIASSH